MPPRRRAATGCYRGIHWRRNNDGADRLQRFLMAAEGKSVFAAVDLGSNSFHMVVAVAESEGSLRPIDRLREPVRLAAGLDAEKRITPEAQQRALACLERFGGRLRHLEAGTVRALGTNTLRRARDIGAFLAAAERALGHPIEIVSGYEEARLVYLGVADSHSFNQCPRLVVDIGGGSTELVLGVGRRPADMESIHLGCVSVSETYFPAGVVTAEATERAALRARYELEPVQAVFAAPAWEQAVGASGTVRAVAAVIAERSGGADGVITSAGLQDLRSALVACGEVNRATGGQLSADRQQVFPGGVAILSGLFDAFGIEELEVADGALREGVLYDLVGRWGAADIRAATVANLARRYHVDMDHAERVTRSALRLLDQVDEGWGLEGAPPRRMLAWAAQLHEIGLDISHVRFHRHGAYILYYSDMAGFSRQEQQVLATLVRAHRRKVARAELNALPEHWIETGWRLAVLLRLAVVLHRGRAPALAPEPTLCGSPDAFELRFPAGLLEGAPLLRTDLEQERRHLHKVGIRLDLY